MVSEDGPSKSNSLHERATHQRKVEGDYTSLLPPLRWVDGVSSVPWPQFLQKLMKLYLCFIVFPVSGQLVWMKFWEGWADAQYMPIGILFCWLGGWIAFCTAGADHGIDRNEADADGPDMAQVMGQDWFVQKANTCLEVFTNSNQASLDSDGAHHRVMDVNGRTVPGLFFLSLILYGSLFYPMGYLSHVHWHYDRCKLTCQPNVTTNSTSSCVAEEQSKLLFPMHLRDGSISAPLFFNNWVFDTPVEDVSDECRKLLGTRHWSKAWKAILKDQGPFRVFFVKMTLHLGISKIEIYGPMLAGGFLTMLIAAVRVEAFKVHQVGWARIALLDGMQQQKYEQVRDMALKMVKVKDIHNDMQPKLFAQLFGIEEARKMFPECDPSHGLLATSDRMLALSAAILHSVLPCFWRWLFLANDFVPFAGKYMWWLVMLKIAVAEGTVLYVGFLVNLLATRTYDTENVLYLLFHRRWALRETFQVERTDTRTIQTSYQVQVDNSLKSRTAVEEWVSATQRPGKINDEDMDKWLHLQELIILSTIAPRTAQALHLWILLLWYVGIFLIAVSNFILEWPREFRLRSSDVVAFLDFVLVGYLVHTGMQLYVRMEKLKKHDLESLERIDCEWDFFSPPVRDDGRTEESEARKHMRWLVKARIHDLTEGRYAVSASSRHFNDNTFKRTMASIVVSAAGMGMRIVVNIVFSSTKA